MNARPLATVQTPSRFVFDDGAAYEQMMGRWSALVAAPFLDWLALPEGLDWLDAGCGNGAFTEALVALQRPRSVTGVDPAPAQLAFARQRPGIAGARFLEGDAQSLPMPESSVDAAAMALVLFFLPDPLKGLQELARVVRPGGTIGAYHWDLAAGGFPLQPILDAVRAEGHQAAEPPSAWVASEQASQDLWRSVGLVDVQAHRFEVERGFGSFDEFWRTAHGSPRLRGLFLSLPPDGLQRLKDRVREALGATDGGPIVLKAAANAVKGRVA